MPNCFVKDYKFKEVKFANTLVRSFKSATMCAKKPWKIWNKPTNTTCMRSHYSVEKERKTIACLINRIPQRARVFLQHNQSAQQPVCPVCSDEPKPSSHLFSPKDTRLFREGGGWGSHFSSSFICLAAASPSQQCHSQYIWDNLGVNMDFVVQCIRVRTFINCEDSEVSSKRHF